MSQKRKLSEYQDPDYLKIGHSFPKRPRESVDSIKIETDAGTATDKTVVLHNKRDKILAILQKELKQELENKEKEILTISNRISIAKRLLQKIRYAVVVNYYNKASIIGSETQEISLENSTCLGQQTSFHPAVKDVLGMKSEDYNELLKTRPTRQAAQNAKTTIKEKLQTKKDKRDEKLKYQQSTEDLQTITATANVVPLESRYLMEWEKPVAIINTSRGINQIRQLIVVGNTSKYIGNENSTDNATHKWLIYCQSRTKCPIEKFIKKIRFILHPSYKPNDVIDIMSYPFQLTRRGWGEFPVQVQLYFHNELQQKPLQVVHNLVLDKKMTGLQTMGSETLLEIWLRSSFFKEHEAINMASQNQNSLRVSSAIDPNIELDNLDESQSSFTDNDNDNEIEFKPYTLSEASSEIFSQNMKNLHKDFSCEGEKKKCATMKLTSEGNNVQILELPSDADNKNEVNINRKNFSCKNSKALIMSSKNNAVMRRNQQSLLKPQISLLKKSVISARDECMVNRFPNPIDHDYTLPNVEEKKPEIHHDIGKKATNDYQTEFEHKFFLRKFTNENQAIEFLLKSIPLVDSKARDACYKLAFPFVVTNLETYHKLIAPKRKSNEWLQAKYFSQIMRNHKQFSNSFWTTREILLFSRSHGYSPNILARDINTTTEDFSELIKNEIKKQIVEPITVTSCNSIYSWLNDVKQKNICNLNKIEYDEILDVERVDDSWKIEKDKEIASVNPNRILLEIPKNLKSEENIVKSSCFDIGIQLRAEEIIAGVDCPAAELVLSKALKCFIEDLTRRTVFKLNERSPNIPVIKCHHIKNAILSYKNLDFLTNNYLGT